MRRRLLLYGLALPLAAALSAAALWRPPADCDTLASSAEIEMRVGLYEEAERLCAEVLEREPSHLRALLVSGACAEFRGEKERACERYRRALAATDDAAVSADLSASLALLETDLGLREAAAADLRAAEKGPPGLRAKATYAKAVHAQRFGDPQAARAGLAEAFDLAASDVGLQTGIGERYVELGAREEALSAFEAAGANGYAPAIYACARLKFEGGDVERGLTDLAKLEARNRGWLRRQMEKDASFWAPIRERGDLPEGFPRAGEDGRGPRKPGPG